MYLYVSCAFDINTFSTYVDMAELFWWVPKGFLEKQDQGSPDQGSRKSNIPIWDLLATSLTVYLDSNHRRATLSKHGCLPFGKKSSKLKCTHVRQRHVQPLRVFTKTASLMETRDFNPLLYDIDLINDDVFLLLYPSLLLPELRFAL